MESKSSFNLMLLMQELFQRKFFVAVVFAVISISIVLVGTKWPKQFASSTTIFVEEENILGPLMQGAAVQTDVIDRASIAREIIFGHNIMYKLLEEEGLKEKYPDPVKQERLMESIKSRLNIANVRNNLIKIEYHDGDPESAFRITDQIAKLFIEESLADKSRQSIDAFEFIDKQVQEYKKKLQKAEEELEKFRSENVDAQPGIAGSIGRHSAELRTRKEQITQELKEAKIRKTSLKLQLSGEAQASSVFSRSEQYKTRIAELQGQLDTLRLSYHESYPDIAQLKAQIQDLRNAVVIADQESSTNQVTTIDERILSNPVYQQLQRNLYDTNTNIQMLNARLLHTDDAIQKNLERARSVEKFGARLTELTRDYDVNSESYSDLISRREQARVSMNLDKDRKGLSLRIDEQAYLPHSPSGVRFLHFLLIGPVLGLVIPMGIIFLIIQFSPAIRSESSISEHLGIPVLASTSHLSTPFESRWNIFNTVVVLLIMVGTISFIISMGILRMQGEI